MICEQKSYCCYCGKWIVYPLKKTVEHIIPKSKGGNNTHWNLRKCCMICNQWRGDKNLTYWKSEIQELLDNNRVRPPQSRLDLKNIIKNIDLQILYINSIGIKPFINNSYKENYTI